MKDVERFVSQFKSFKILNSPSVCVCAPLGKRLGFPARLLIVPSELEAGILNLFHLHQLLLCWFKTKQS